MANADLNIQMNLSDNATAGIRKASQEVDRLELSFKKAGKELSQFGSKLFFVGSSMITPFALAMNQAGKTSLAVAGQNQVLSSTFQKLSNDIAVSALPTIRKFNDAFVGLAERIDAVDPKLKESTAKFILVSGAILLATGATAKFVGALIQLAPALATIAVAMASFEASKKSYGNALLSGFTGLGGIVGQGKGKTAMKDAVDDLKKALEQIKKIDVKGLGSDMASFWKEAEKFMSGSGGASGSSKNFVFWQSFQQTATQSIGQVANAMKTQLGDSIFNALTGRLASVKDAFRAFGEDILRILSQAIAKLLLVKALSSFGGGWGTAIAGMIMHDGGTVRRAHSGLAPDEIPIVAQTGEGILSRRGMNALGGSNNLRRLNKGQSVGGGGGGGANIQPIMVIQAWDTQDVYRNRKALASALGAELQSNGKFRESVKRYG